MSDDRLLAERADDGDAEAAAELVAALAADPARRAAWLADRRFAIQLAAELRAASGWDPAAQVLAQLRARRGGHSARLARRAPRRRTRRRAALGFALALTTAAAALLAVVIGPSRTAESSPEREDACVLVARAGTMRVERGGAALATGETLRPGDRLVGSGGAWLRWADGTRVDLHDGELALLPGPGKRLTFVGGTLTAEVAPQAPGAPLVIATPAGDATVRGTAFRLRASSGGTRLDVDSGVVALGAGSDVVQVPANVAATLAAGGSPRLAAFVPAPGTDPLYRLEVERAGPGIGLVAGTAIGTRGSARLRGGLLAEAGPEASVVSLDFLKARLPSSLPKWQPGCALLLTYRTAPGAHEVHVQIYHGGQRQNYGGPLALGEPGVWITTVVPFDTLRAYRDPAARWNHGDQPMAISVISTPAASALEVRDIAIVTIPEIP